MQQIILFFCIATFSLMISCKSDSKTGAINGSKINDSTTILLEDLSLIKSQDYLTHKDSIIYLSPERLCEVNNQIFVFYNKQKLYVTDLDLRVIKIISLKEEAFLIKGKVYDIEIINSNVLILDNSNSIKKISLDFDDPIDEIKLDIKGSESLYTGGFTSLIAVGENHLLTTNTIQPFVSISDTIPFEIGKMFDIDGKFITAFEINSGLADPNWNKFFDLVYATYYKDKIYFSFLISRKVFVFNVNGILLNDFELEVDKNYWFEINTETSEGETFGIKTTSIKSKFVPICNNGLQIRNGFIYSHIFQGEHKVPKLVKYNMEFDIVEEISIDVITPLSPEFKLYIVKDRLYLDNGVIHIFMKKNEI